MKRQSRSDPYVRSTHWFVLLAMLLALPVASAGQTVHVTNDTNINLSMPTQVNGSATVLVVRNVGSEGERQTYLQFDLDSLPPAGVVTKAVLRLFVNDVTDPGTIDVHAVLDPWDETTLTVEGN